MKTHSIQHQGHQLCAFNRESAAPISDFIKSGDREVSDHKWASLLLHLPTVLKRCTNRDAVVKKFDKIIAV